MTWTVALHDDFLPEYDELPQEVQDELLAKLGLLEQFGPQLRRPHVDTLKGSRRDNMKELRFYAADAAWRFLFAFDPNRSAIVLCGGTKSGGSEDLFYRKMVAKADSRFDAHLAQIQAKETRGKKQRDTTQIRKQKKQ